ncbi:MAG TPA: hypothetical protein VGC34_17890 [Steroidobacteraceae bacterium]
MRKDPELVMVDSFLDIAMTPSVRAARAAMGTDHIWRAAERHPTSDRFTEQEVAEAVQPLEERLARLESENADLRAGSLLGPRY